MNEPWAEQWLTKHLIGEGYFITVANPDLHISGVWGGGGHPHSEIRGTWSPKNIFFRPFRPHFGQNIREGSVPPPPRGPSPGSTTVLYCCKPPGKQHTNLWASCGFLGVLSLFRRYNLDWCLSGWFLARMSRGVIITLFHIIHPHCIILIALSLAHYCAYKQIQSIFVWL